MLRILDMKIRFAQAPAGYAESTYERFMTVRTVSQGFRTGAMGSDRMRSNGNSVCLDSNAWGADARRCRQSSVTAGRKCTAASCVPASRSSSKVRRALKSRISTHQSYSYIITGG